MDLTSFGVGGGSAGAAFALFGWLLRRSVSQNDQKLIEHEEEIKNIAKALDGHKLHVAEHYVTQNELTKAVESLDKTMQRLIDAVNQNSRETREGFSEIHRRIDGKADK